MLNLRLAVLVGLLPLGATAQSVISTHSGTVHYFEGDVSINGQPLVAKHARFDEVREQEVLRTGRGRAELLLAPGVFLRVGENSAVRMLDNRLASTRIELVSGTVIVESDAKDASMKDTPLTLIYGDHEVRMVKQALFEMSADPAEIRVYKGEAELATGEGEVRVKDAHKTALDAVSVEKFDAKNADDLYLWARDRSESISAANMASARNISSAWSSPTGYARWDGGWYYNSYLGMFSYVPASGMSMSPFGFGMYSPMAIYAAYSPVYSFAPGLAPHASVTPAAPGSLASPVRASLSAGGAPQLGSPIRSGAGGPSFSGGRTGGPVGVGRARGR